MAHNIYKSKIGLICLISVFKLSHGKIENSVYGCDINVVNKMKSVLS